MKDFFSGEETDNTMRERDEESSVFVSVIHKRPKKEGSPDLWDSFFGKKKEKPKDDKYDFFGR